MKNGQLYSLYKKLLRDYGKPSEIWPQWCASEKTCKLRDLITIGSILVQRTSWFNADLALKNLQENNLTSLMKLANSKDLEKLKSALRPAGFYQTKTKRLLAFSKFVTEKYENLEKMMEVDLETLRKELLNVYGVGPETADTILLYALDKPTFVVDEYAKKFVTKHKLTSHTKYEDLKAFFETSLPKSREIFQNYHVLIIVDHKGREKSIMPDMKVP
ncbi:MAG: endonuclease [bacterium]|nr:endonuclease [bacterium]